MLAEMVFILPIWVRYRLNGGEGDDVFEARAGFLILGLCGI